jgi:AMP-binding enzyme/AMP-binding enzyme C-terminal domain/Phosphopantetheine attachment site
MLVDAGWHGSDRLRIACGGEPVPAALVEELHRRAQSVWHMYGPTETTVWSSIAEIAPADGPPAIGGPIANTRFAVLDRGGRLAPTGVPGELVIGGAGVACGYRGQPELTAERFVDDPTSPGSVAYRTGDIVRRRRDGTLEFLGRLDNQVKLRGFRIELGEIESVLMRHPLVGQAVVTMRDDLPGDRRLIAYLVAAGKTAPTASELREHLLATLPAYMVPAAFVALDALPVSANSKIDRDALPAPSGALTTRKGRLVAPRTPIETLVADAWREVLAIEQIGIYDDFFELGGNSLLLARVNARLARSLGIRLPLRRLFELPVLADVSGELVGRLAEASAGGADGLERLFEELEEPHLPLVAGGVVP